MAAVKTLVVCLVLIVAWSDAVHLFSPFRHGRNIAVEKVVEEEANFQLPRHSFPAPRLNAAANATYNFAVDITANGSASTFQCLYKQGYSAVFIQAYSRDYGGSLNPNLIQNLNNAGAANLGSELYVTLTTEKEGQPQFDAVYNKLKASGINLRSIWLQVTSPLKWNTNVNTNLHRIQNFINRGYATGVTVGIYTNWYDWQQITGSAFSDLRLWYWSATPGQFSLPYYQFLAISFTSRRIDGPGSNAESAANFDDFRQFSSFLKPAVKQFGINENLCGMTLNRDVYPAASKSVAAEETNNVDRKLNVGGFV
uniref:Uncharacterized protein n=1 Tax=Panagrolaimus sp. ES5 TaxID=591445 RepID=A0AC34EZG0_9BILA